MNQTLDPRMINAGNGPSIPLGFPLHNVGTFTRRVTPPLEPSFTNNAYKGRFYEIKIQSSKDRP